MKITNTVCHGQGVVVSPNLVMTALHGKFEIDESEFEITDSSNNVRIGQLYRQWFEEFRVDIALIRLKENVTPFDQAFEVSRHVPKLMDKILIASWQPTLSGSMQFGIELSRFTFADDGAIYRAHYYSLDGLSGCGIVTNAQSDGNIRVIGVHSGVHDNTESIEPMVKKGKTSYADFRSVSSSHNSMVKNLHGHNSINLICVASLVPELLGILDDEIITLQ